MPGGTFSSIAAAMEAIALDIKVKERRLDGAIRKAARATRNDVIREVPRAFGELASSIHVEDGTLGTSTVVADAPHAAAVELGSRPHTSPLGPLIAWVKLRGMQGLQSPSRVRPSSRAHATRVARELRGMESGGALDVDAPVAIAKAIQRKISLVGTKPHRFMAQGVDYAIANLDALVKEALDAD